MKASTLMLVRRFGYRLMALTLGETWPLVNVSMNRYLCQNRRLEGRSSSPMWEVNNGGVQELFWTGHAAMEKVSDAYGTVVFVDAIQK